jgi:predicted aminopeptidase
MNRTRIATLSRRLAVLLFCAMLQGCATIHYYGQAVVGQVRLLAARQDIDDVLAHADTPSARRDQLGLVLRLRDFAARRLSLPVNHAYLSFVELSRRYVVWNVIATPELDMEARQWCFPVTGCLAYRGWFDERDARRDAASLERAGYDVHVGGVAAYSTLGWFDDPVLNTMLDRPPTQLARLLFHELAHRKLYFPDDTEMSEAYAEAVGLIGARLWNEQQGIVDDTLQRQFDDELRVTGLIAAYRGALEAFTRGDTDIQAKRQEKARLLAELQARYVELTDSLPEPAPYDSWIRGALNNAKLASFATYHRLVPLLLEVHARCGGDIDRFHTLLAGLQDDRAGQRHERLAALASGDCRTRPGREVVDNSRRAGRS